MTYPGLSQPAGYQMALQQGWQAAIQLYLHLSAGGAPQPVRSSVMLADGPVYLDTGFQYARFYGQTVEYTSRSTFAFGSPLFVATAMLAGAAANAADRRRAEILAAPQWREHSVVRTVLTQRSTWCSVQGRWLSFEHDAIVEYGVDPAAAACLFTFFSSEPLRLQGPPAWYHAVLLAYLKLGPRNWRQAVFLDPLRVAAQQTLDMARARRAPDAEPPVAGAPPVRPALPPGDSAVTPPE
jgi:hypothetical protein